MADKKKTDRDLDADDEEEKQVKQPMSMKKIIILMSSAFAVVLIATVVTLVLVLGDDDDAATASAEQVDGVDKGEAKTTAKKEAAATDVQMTGPAIFYTIRPVFVVNLQSKRVKFLQINVDIMTRDESVIDAVIDHLPLIKNDLVTLFSSKKYDDVKEVKGREALRKEALEVVGNVLKRETGRSGVIDILFTSFVMQ